MTDRVAVAVAQVSPADSTYDASLARDIERGGPIEADHVLGSMLERCRAHGARRPDSPACVGRGQDRWGAPVRRSTGGILRTGRPVPMTDVRPTDAAPDAVPDGPLRNPGIRR